MAYAEEHIGYTRTGYHGRTTDGRSVGRYEAGEGLIWTGWKHSTNREKEPQLHTHVAVLNRLRTLSDGLIRALDGRGIRPVKEAIATAYDRALEEELVAARGVVMADRPDGKAREIVGVDPQLCADASTRRAQTLAKAEELTALYIARNGREPDAAARKAILTDAALATRQPKDSSVAGPAAVAAWGQLDPERAAKLVATVEAVADAAEAAAMTGHPDVVAGLRLDPTDPAQRRALLAAAVADVQHEYATWTVGNLVAAIDRRVGPLPVDAGGQARPLYLEGLAREAVEPGNAHGVVLLTAPDPVEVPEELRRAQDGRSIFRPHLDERFATLDQLQAEERIVTAARQLTAPAIRGPELELLRVELAAAGLGPDQVDAVAGIVSSGRAGDVLIGPAGTGKSYTVAALAQVWEQRVGGRVLGLATTEIAARNLAEDGVAAMNTARFLALYGSGPDGEPARERVGSGDLYVIDEAGMSGTPELAQICDIIAAGGKILYTGDHGQLTSIGAGGMLALLAHDNGAHELAEVHRFNHDWERDASLRLRAGDTSVIPEYEDRGRLHGGTREQMQAAAIRGYLADTLAGKESLLIVGSNADAAQLSREIRNGADPIRPGGGRAVTELGMRADRVGVSVGDVVQARMVDRTIRVDGGGIVANRATYTVLGMDEDGALRVRGARGEIAHLPRSYVDQHLTLAYASTVHAAQSRTVDTSHALLDEAAAREAAYVALSRGREANTAYLVALRDPDEHQPERLDGTAAGRLAAVLGQRRGPARRRGRAPHRRPGRGVAGVDRHPVGRGLPRLRPGPLHRGPGRGAPAGNGRPGHRRSTDGRGWCGRCGRPSWAGTTPTRCWPARSRAGRWTARSRCRMCCAGGCGCSPRTAPPNSTCGPGTGPRWRRRWTARSGSSLTSSRCWPGIGSTSSGRPRSRRRPRGRSRSWARRRATTSSPRRSRPACRSRSGPSTRSRPPGSSGRSGPARWPPTGSCAASPRTPPRSGPRPAGSRSSTASCGPRPRPAFGHAVDAGAVDYRTLPDLDLYAVRDRWTREQAWAPEYVAAEMRTAYELGREYTEDAALAGARLATLEPDDPEWEPTAEQLARSQRLADLNLERARQLEEIHHARGGWYEATEEARIADEAARDELARRGLPLQRVLVEPEQLELFDPADVAEPAVEGDSRGGRAGRCP